jgi:ABC-type multidrug transport system fused ATPase/permease subunit
MENAIKTKANRSLLLRSIGILEKRDKYKLIVMSGIQVFLGFLDLIGVAAIGALGALAISGIQSKVPGNRVYAFLSFFNIENLSFQNQAALLGVFATFVLVGRTFLSILFTRRTLFFLGRRGAQISAELVSRLLSQSFVSVQARTSQETLYATTRGVEIVTLGVLGTLVTIVSDLSALTFLAVGLFVIDPIIAFSCFVIFSIVGFVLYRLLHQRARTLGLANTQLVIESNDKILEVVSSYREALVHNRREFYANEISNTRRELADTLAELNFMPNISKYVIETTVLIGALVIGAVQFILEDATHATATLSVFLAAGTRIAPAVLRIQQGTLLIKSNLAQADPTLQLVNELRFVSPLKPSPTGVDVLHEGFHSCVKMEEVSFTYLDKNVPAISGINLQIDEGSSIAFVGPSGAGKSTILDVLLGILTPDRGRIEISGLTPLESIEKWPGAISYVPQDVQITQGTIRENVALGFPKEVASDELVWSALETAQLAELVRSLPHGIDSYVGEKGSKLSGGQRQRLGIARAMFTNPKLLLLDEATSSLDGEVEAAISSAINELKGSVTVIMIAHRLSTVRELDKVVYVENGKILAQGTFEQVRTNVKNFDKQATLMGL